MDIDTGKIENILENIFRNSAVSKKEKIEKILSKSYLTSIEKDTVRKSLVLLKSGKEYTSTFIVRHEKAIENNIKKLHENQEVFIPVAVDVDIVESVCMDFIARSKEWDDAHTRAHVHSQLMKSSSRVVVLGGAPGTAKSTSALELMKAYKIHRERYIKQKDIDNNGLWVLAINPFSMEKWRERAGVQGATLDQILTTEEMGVETIPKGAFVVVDEAGLIGTEKMSQLLQKAVEDNWQKLVLLGDVKQDLPNEYGQPLVYIIKKYPDLSFELKTPFRQRLADEQKLVQDLYDGQSNKAIQYLKSKDRVVIDKHDVVVQKLIQSFASWRSKGKNNTKQCLILVQDEKKAYSFTKELMSYQQQQGIVKYEYPYQGPFYAWSMGKGDRVMLQQPLYGIENGKKQEFGRGTLGTVVESDKDKMRISIDRKGNVFREVIIERKTPYLISPAYVLTFSQAQGIAADYTAVFISKLVSGASIISACSRHRYACELYIDSKAYPDTEKFENDIQTFPVKRMPYLDGEIL